MESAEDLQVDWTNRPSISDERWRWLSPDEPHFKMLAAEVAAHVSSQQLDAKNVIQYVCSTLQAFISGFLRSCGRYQGQVVDDLVHDVLVRATTINVLKMWRPQSGSLMDLLCGIARNVARETIRKSARSTYLEFHTESYQCESIGPDEVAERQDLLAMVRHWIDELPPKQREAIVRGYLDDAGDSNLRQQSVKQDYVNRSRGLSQLRAKARAAGLLV
jgi:RNA polymerase sigma factor (sigma-70 family)